jgi:hypothetical protein
MAMAPTACVDIMLAHRTGGPGGLVRLVVHDTIMLIWTMTGSTASDFATTTRIMTTAGGKITVHAARTMATAFQATTCVAAQPVPTPASE